MEVIVKDGELNKALKVFTQMIKKSELLQELRNREHYLKPSKKKKYKQIEAIRRKKRDAKRVARQSQTNHM